MAGMTNELSVSIQKLADVLATKDPEGTRRLIKDLGASVVTDELAHDVAVALRGALAAHSNKGSSRVAAPVTTHGVLSKVKPLCSTRVVPAYTKSHGGFRGQLFVADDGPGITVATGPVRRTQGAAERDGLQLFAGQYVEGTEWDHDGWQEAMRRATAPVVSDEEANAAADEILAAALVRESDPQSIFNRLSERAKLAIERACSAIVPERVAFQSSTPPQIVVELYLAKLIDDCAYPTDLGHAVAQVIRG